MKILAEKLDSYMQLFYTVGVTGVPPWALEWNYVYQRKMITVFTPL